MLTLKRALVMSCALALGAAGTASAGETPAELACNRCGTTARKSCYDPCEPVGPIRRLWRSLFRRPCPPTVVAAPLAVPPPPPACAPAALGFPAAPAPRADVSPGDSHLPPPPPSPAAPFTGSSRTAPPPARSDLRFERMASLAPQPSVVRAKAPEPTRVLLISAQRSTERHRLMTDSQGGVTADLPGGEWLIFTQNEEGALTFRGSVKAVDGKPTRVNLSR
jgi:hypothetical protein